MVTVVSCQSRAATLAQAQAHSDSSGALASYMRLCHASCVAVRSQCHAPSARRDNLRRSLSNMLLLPPLLLLSLAGDLHPF